MTSTLKKPLTLDTPSDVDQLVDGNGLYVRPYERGIVIVNAGTTAKTFTLEGAGLDTTQQYDVVMAFGGGFISTDGLWETPGGLVLKPLDNSVQLGPWSAAILMLAVPEPTSSTLLGLGLVAALVGFRSRRFSR